MQSHTIRLMTPWYAAQGAAAVPESPSQRFTLPLLVGRPDSGWPVCYSRRFHVPTGLSASTRVFLRVSLASGVLCVRLNGLTMIRSEVSATIFRTVALEHGEHCAFEIFEITKALRPYNLVELEIREALEADPYAVSEARLPELTWVSLEIVES